MSEYLFVDCFAMELIPALIYTFVCHFSGRISWPGLLFLLLNFVRKQNKNYKIIKGVWLSGLSTISASCCQAK